ncbi:hypothetical protein BD770DRAFT_192166 [Pilaira anomala]|nr:hypothetical protein BD770DRAFT_192166 [Pilaira anomala]
MKIRKKTNCFLFYLQNNYLSMAKESNEFGISLLSKCYPNGALPPEIDGEGNIEYKLKLINPSIERLEHLITQMKWR